MSSVSENGEYPRLPNHFGLGQPPPRIEAKSDQYLDDLREAVARRYAELTVDAKPQRVISVPDFRPRKGIQIETYGFVTALGDLEGDPYAAAELIVAKIIESEEEVIAMTMRPRARCFLNGRREPVIFRRTPSGTAQAMRDQDTIKKLIAEGYREDELTYPDEAEREEQEIKVRHDFAVLGDVDDPEPVKTALWVGSYGEYPIVSLAR